MAFDHWVLAVVEFLPKRIKIYDACGEKLGSQEDILDNLFKFLECEFERKGKEVEPGKRRKYTFVKDEWSLYDVDLVKVPQQHEDNSKCWLGGQQV